MNLKRGVPNWPTKMNQWGLKIRRNTRKDRFRKQTQGLLMTATRVRLILWIMSAAHCGMRNRDKSGNIPGSGGVAAGKLHNLMILEVLRHLRHQNPTSRGTMTRIPEVYPRFRPGNIPEDGGVGAGRHRNRMKLRTFKCRIHLIPWCIPVKIISPERKNRKRIHRIAASIPESGGVVACNRYDMRKHRRINLPKDPMTRCQQNCSRISLRMFKVIGTTKRGL